jgi:mono/diheme cytochrome c family protein
MRIAEVVRARQSGPRGASGHYISGATGSDGLCAGEGQEGFLLNVLRLAPGMVAICAALQVTPATAQGNIDAGKSPAQIFGDTCSACHRSAREFQRISAGFLRTHYTAGSEEASAMAAYLVGIANDAARPSQPKRPPAEVGKQQPQQPQPPHQQPPQRHPPDQAKAAQGQSKGRQGATAQATRPVAAEERPAPEPLPPPPAPVAPPAPVLEPFEE